MPFFKPLKKKKSTIQKFLGFDIETYGATNEFMLGVFTNGVKTEICRTIEEVQNFLDLHSTREYKIIATNVGFDFLGTFRNLSPDQYSVSERNGVLYYCKYYQKKDRKKAITFYDTLRFFPASVEKLGRIVGLAKSPHPSFFPKKPKNEKQWEELTEYCYNDALISYLFMENFILKYIYENDLTLKCTIASMSMADFKTNYLKDTLKVECAETHRICFTGYYGGRTETFRRGTFKDVRCYDFISLYPSVMIKEMPHPSHSRVYKQCEMYNIINQEGICYVEGEQKDCFIPLLPVRHEGKLIFPTGHIQGYYTFVELREAIKNGFTILKFGDGVVYTKTKKFFEEFVKDKSAIRKKQKENGDEMQLMSKNIQNNLYGKFAFNYAEATQIVARQDLKGKLLEQAVRIDDLGAGFYSVNTQNPHPPSYSFPIWSAYITAYARIKLYKKLVEFGDNVTYCDTDSLFLVDGVTTTSGNNLGDLEHEYSCDSAIFVRPKFYFSKKAVVKGVRRIADREQFIKICNGEEIVEDYFVKLRTALRSKDHHKDGKLQINQIIQRTKTLKVEDSKRKWSKAFDVHNSQTSRPRELIKSDYTIEDDENRSMVE